MDRWPEKLGLLPSRPLEDGLRWGDAEDSIDDVRETSRGRRPADVYLPRGIASDAMALGFAYMSWLRSHYLREVADNPSAVITDYEHFNRHFPQLGTQERSQQAVLLSTDYR